MSHNNNQEMIKCETAQVSFAGSLIYLMALHDFHNFDLGDPLSLADAKI